MNFLPYDVVFQIVNHPALSSEDRARIAVTCREMRAIVAECTNVRFDVPLYDDARKHRLLSVLTTSASTRVDVDVDVGSHYSCSMCEMCEIARDHPDLAKRVRSLRVWCQMPYDQNALRDLLGDLLPRLRRIVLTRVCTNPPAFALADSRVHLECPRMFMGGLDDSDMQTITRVGALGSRTVDTLCVWAHFTPGVVDELKNASAAGLRAREVAITWYNRGTFQATSPPDEWVPVVNVAIKSLSLSQNGFSH